MSSKFKESRGKKLLQLISSRDLENKENCDDNCVENEVMATVVEDSMNVECDDKYRMENLAMPTVIEHPNNVQCDDNRDHENKENCDDNDCVENEVMATGLEDSMNIECDYNCVENQVMATVMEESKNFELTKENDSNECLEKPVDNPEPSQDSEPVAHCSYSTSTNKSSHISGVYEPFSEDDDDSVKDPNYKSTSASSSTSSNSRSSSSSSSSSSCSSSRASSVISASLLNDHAVSPVNTNCPQVSNNTQTNENEVVEQNTTNLTNCKDNDDVKKCKKRQARVDEWLTNKAKKLRNTGKAYISRSKTKKAVPARAVKQHCGDKCKMKCSSKIDEEQRKIIFSKYWELGDVTLQRNFINSSTEPIMPAIRFSAKQKPRSYNNAYYFTVDDEKIRVCKKFFMATLDVNDRVIRTVFKKRELGFIETEKRGKHGNHKKVDESIKESVRQHIQSIPRIESHYIRKTSSREYIDGGKCLTDLHADYKKQCDEQGIPAAHYEMYTKIFNREFNISFFIPKKDRCELCVSYENADAPGKEKLRDKYLLHLEEKELSREEKEDDKAKVNTDYVVAVYDLQAVLQIPKGDVSVFYYKSKLNNLNFTISELGSDHTECYLWHEGEANRGADEIGTCVLNFIDKIMNDYCGSGLELTFFSDNCCGQQKNRFIFSMYIFALIKYANIKSITHKYLITGHTQNEGDSVHSTIEKSIKKNLRSGPIYVPSQYAQIIRNSKKKGNPYHVNEMSFKDFFSMKSLADDMGFNAKNLKTAEIKVFKVIQGEPSKVFIKHSYKQTVFQEVQITKRQLSARNIKMKPAYKYKPNLKENKKRDLLSLVESNHIPNFYASFFKNL